MQHRIVLLLFLSFLVSSPATAQFKAGLTAGFTFAQVDGDRLSGYNKTGLTGGILIDHPIKEDWKAGFEIMYTMKGSKQVSDPDNPSPEQFRLRFDYIEFPLKVTYSWSDFSAYAGPTIGVNVVSWRDEYSQGWTDATIRPLEFGALLGIQYNLTEKVSAGLRHQNSLIRVGDDYANGLNIWNRVGLYNRLFAVYATVNLSP